MDYNDFFEQKRIIDELEGSLTGAPIYATNPELLTVAVEVGGPLIKTSKFQMNFNKIFFTTVIDVTLIIILSFPLKKK